MNYKQRKMSVLLFVVIVNYLFIICCSLLAAAAALGRDKWPAECDMKK